MSTQTLPPPVETANADDLIHTVCCDPNTALCGADVSGEGWYPDGTYPDDCLVCEYLAALPSPCCEAGRSA